MLKYGKIDTKILRGRIIIEKHDKISGEYKYLAIIPAVFLLTAILAQPSAQLFSGLGKIIVCKDILLTDYLEIAGVGPAFLNASLIGFLAIYMLWRSKTPLNGLVVASVFTIIGFAFIGKSILNVLPIYMGGYLYHKYTKEPMSDIVVSLLFGTTLAPLVSEIVFGFSLKWYISIPAAVLTGIIFGFIVTPVGRQVACIHSGYNLYNIGFTGGIIATVTTSIFRSFGLNMETQLVLSFHYHRFLMIYLSGLFVVLIILGIYLSKGNFDGLKKIVSSSGVAPSDFLTDSGTGATMINMGVMGLVSVLYVVVSGGSLNGPTLAGAFTVIGFAAYGKHMKNTIPILVGVYVASSINMLETSSTSVIISGLFGTTLAPIAGKFGAFAGFIAGFLHLAVVTNLLSSHGGLNLYNNGFSGGFVAAIMVPICLLLQQKTKNKKPS